MEEFRHITMITAIILAGVSQSAVVFAGSGNCELPTIKNADINMTGINRFSEGTVVHFHCLPGFRPVGDGLYRCANSIWVGGNFSCLIKTCPLLESPKNGEMIGDNYEVGSVMRYKCDIGFELIGSKTSLCKMDQQWDPPNVPECRIKKCLAAPVIEHGDCIPENKIEGFDYNDYGATLRAICNVGYVINGPVRIYCDSKGQWTQIPECRPISCPAYPGLDAKCIRKTTLADKTLLIIFCTANSTLISARDATASCENNMWDDLTIRCLCDCEIKADNEFVHIENLNSNGLLKHNESSEWSCKNGSTKTFNDSLTCIDGSIKPQGWGCFIPSLTSVDPLEGTSSGAIDKSRDENDDDNVALAGLKIALIAIGVIGAIVAIIMVFYVLKRRRDRSSKDREKPHHQDPTGSETDLNGATDTVQEKTEQKSMSWCFNCLKRSKRNDELEKEIKQVKIEKAEVRNREAKIAKLEQYIDTKSNRPVTSPLKKIPPNFADQLYIWEQMQVDGNKNSQDDTELSKPSRCDEAEALLPSQAQTKIPVSQDINKPIMDNVCEIAGDAATNASEFESNLSSREKQKSLFIPTTGERKHKIGSYPMQAEDQEKNNLCPRCGRIVYQAEACLDSGRMWHRKCYYCDKCGNYYPCLYGHADRIYCKHCYDKEVGWKKHLRYPSQNALDKDEMDQSTIE